MLLLAGLEINVAKLKRLTKDSVLISIFGAIIPFILGYFAVRALGFPNTTAIITGICLAITAEGTTLKILIDKNLLDTKVGTIILSAGLLDDLYGIIFLGSFLMFLRDDKTLLFTYPLMILGFVGTVMVLFFILPKLIRKIEGEHSRIANLSMVIIIGLTIASLSNSFGLGPILGAFLAGILVHWVNKDKKEEHDIVDELKILTFAFIIPFFFINIGMNMEIFSVGSNLLLIAIITVIAIIGKLLGSVIVSLITDIKFRQAMLIGWGMNSRGAIELVIATVALTSGFITTNIYTAIVIMAVLTTMFFPFVLEKMVAKYPKIMNE